MTKKKWIIGLISMVVLLSMVLAACTPDADVPQPDVEEPVAPEPEEVVVQYWSNSWFPSSIEGRRGLVDKFNQEYAGQIQVEYIQGDWGSGETYIQSGAAAGGGIACVMDWWFTGAHEWYMKDWVIDISPYMTPERYSLMQEEALWDARTYEDGALTMSGTLLSEPGLVFYYNPAHFEAAGIAPATPDNTWTWDELYEYAALLTLDANGNHKGEAGFDPDNVVQWGYTLRIDANKVWEDGMAFAQGRMGQPIVRRENGEWGWFLTDEGAYIYEQFLTGIEQGVTPKEAIGLGGDTIEQMFVDGMTSIMLRPIFTTQILGDNYPNFEFGVMPIPFDPQDTIFYMAGGEGMVITKNCENPEAAAEFIFWTMKPENNAIIAYGNGMIPANYEALDYEPFASDSRWDIIRQYLAQAEVFVPEFNPNYIEFRDTVMGPTLVEVASGNLTFEEANEILEEQAKLILNR